jgi:hypothetical protein
MSNSSSTPQNRITAIDLLKQARDARIKMGEPFNIPLPHLASELAVWLDMMLVEFDYSDHPKSNIAFVCRGLAALSDRFDEEYK